LPTTHFRNAIYWEKLFRRHRPEKNLMKYIPALVFLLIALEINFYIANRQKRSLEGYNVGRGLRGLRWEA